MGKQDKLMVDDVAQAAANRARVAIPDRPAPVTKRGAPATCAICGKQVILSGEPGETCVWCGQPVKKKEVNTMPEVTRLPPVPPRPDVTGLLGWKRNSPIHRYYDANRAQILAEVKQFSKAATAKRWGIPFGSLTRIMGSKQIDAARALGAKESPSATRVAKGDPPPLETSIVFPAFSDKWESETQVAWLQAYVQLAGKGGKAHVDDRH